MNEFEEGWIVQTGATALFVERNVYTELELDMDAFGTL
jgi:hypothetical protein